MNIAYSFPPPPEVGHCGPYKLLLQVLTPSTQNLTPSSLLVDYPRGAQGTIKGVRDQSGTNQVQEKHFNPGTIFLALSFMTVKT